jgi:hypothetical protein
MPLYFSCAAYMPDMLLEVTRQISKRLEKLSRTSGVKFFMAAQMVEDGSRLTQ